MRISEVKVLGRTSFLGAIALALLVPAGPAGAIAPAVVHTTDGMFTSPAEWDTSRPSVTEFTFPVVGNTGGANLFVEQSNGSLFLMYDYVNSNALGLNQNNSSFDVFFQVPNDNTKGGEDYVVHFAGTSFEAFEKPTSGPASNLNPDGSFDLTTIWTPLSSADLALAQFKTAIGFGHNPATPAVPDHLLAEFQLTIQPPGNPGGGFYDPAPAFWSASASGGGVNAAQDPPISSGIFVLNPDGTTTVTPVFGPDGGPVLQPQDVPEPASLALTGLGLALLVAGRCRLARRRGAIEA